MNKEEHDELWELLGKARKPSVSPMFSRNVVREVRQFDQERPGLFSWLRQQWQAPAIAFCAIALSGAMMWQHMQRQETHPSSSNPISSNVAENQTPERDERLLAMAEKVSNSPDYLVINYLDELMDYEENAVWLDSAVY